MGVSHFVASKWENSKRDAGQNSFMWHVSEVSPIGMQQDHLTFLGTDVLVFAQRWQGDDEVYADMQHYWL